MSCQDAGNSNIWPLTQEQEEACTHTITNFYPLYVSPLFTPSLHVSLLCVSACLLIFLNWISLKKEDFSLYVGFAVRQNTQTQTRRGEDMKPSKYVKYLRGPMGGEKKLFCFCKRKWGEGDHKPQKLSFGSAHLVAMHFQECQSERREAQRGSTWVSVIVTRQTDKTDEVWGGRSDMMWSAF